MQPIAYVPAIEPDIEAELDRCLAAALERGVLSETQVDGITVSA